MRTTILFAGILCLAGSELLASGVPLPQPASTTTDGPRYLLADGERVVNIAEKGFSITPPSGWTYATNYPGLTLVMQAPEEKDQVYRRTIQVTSLDGEMIITDSNVEEFQEYLVKKYTEASSSISGYSVRNHLPVDLENGLKGHLFYTEFKIDQVDLMQMHVVVSAEDNYFIATYTDLAKYFDVSESPSEHLNEAWTTANTIKLEKPAQGFLDKMIAWGLYAGIAGIAGIGIFLWRRQQRLKSYERLELEASLGEHKDIDHAPESITPQSLSAVKIKHFEATKHPGMEDDDTISEDDEIDFDGQGRTIKKAS
jgi:hypothetical protein